MNAATDTARQIVTPTLLAKHRIRLAGHPDAHDAARVELEARRDELSRRGGRAFNDALCALQQRESRAGYLPFEIVRTIYGWSVRYASGLQGFGLLAGRMTFAFVQREVGRDPANREAFVFTSDVARDPEAAAIVAELCDSGALWIEHVG